MQKAIILHGLPSKGEYYNPDEPACSNNHWFPWLQKQLTMRDILAQAPEMPKAYEPDYPAWKAVFEQLQPDQDTMLIGHSCGGGFIIRWLSETQTKVGKVVLVAPWLDPKQQLGSDFFNFKIDPEIVNKTAGISILISDDDEDTIAMTVERLKASAKGFVYREFRGKGHFCFKSAFPELLAELVPVE